MIEWKAKMPRLLPEKGTVYFVFAVKTETGFRTEHSGTGDAADILKVYTALAGLDGKTA